jgi:hypothetical protein
VGPRAGLDGRKFFTLPGLEFGPLGRSARSQSLYRLSYPGSAFWIQVVLHATGSTTCYEEGNGWRTARSHKNAAL